MVKNLLNTELRAWAMAGMRDPLQDPLPADALVGKTATSIRNHRRSTKKRGIAAGIQLSLFAG